MQNFKDFLQGASNSIASNVSAPVDGIAWLLRKAGIPVPPNPMGGSDWMTEKGLTPQPQNRNMGLLGEFAGMAGPMVAAAKAPQLAKGLLQMGDNLAAPRTMNPQTGAVVWHGSPHKFDKFDSAKIGTGEGAQAYGHGLYLADEKAVASGYQSKLTDDAFKYKAMNDAKMRLNEKLAQRVEASDPARAAAFRAEVASLGEPGGSLYKVDLPDEQIAKMLDWDKPLSGQAPGVQKALGYEVGVTRESLDQAADGLLAKYGPPDKRTPSQQSAFTGEYQALNDKLDRLPPNLTGANFYNGTSPEDYLHQMLSGSSQAEMSAHLRSKGIPGIRYLDGGSRATGGTSNYVVFPGNEGLLNILERNGKGLLE